MIDHTICNTHVQMGDKLIKEKIKSLTSVGKKMLLGIEKREGTT